MRSISLASDGSCLVAGSVKVGREGGALVHNGIDMLIDIGAGQVLRMEDQRRTIRSPKIPGCHYVPSSHQVPHAATFEP